MRLHSLWRGIQSALFYYLSCTPWLKLMKRRRRRKQGKRAKEEQRALELEEPNAYRHPLPFNTNEYWAEEIRLGPGPPPNRLSKKQRQALSRIRPTDSDPRGNTPIADRSASKVDLTDGAKSGKVYPESERWRGRQRADEPLWGSDNRASSSPSLPSLRSAKTNGSSSTRFPHFNAGSASTSSHPVAINPAINDLHPPVVSNPAQGHVSNMWMLQPPPPAAVMSGHDSPTRSRSTTTSSLSSRRAAERPLGRKLSQRMMDEKLRRGGLLYPNDMPRPFYRDVPSQSSLIEARYFDGGYSARNFRRGSSQDSSDTVIRSRSPTIAGVETAGLGDSGIAVGKLPWNVQKSNDGTMRHDFAFPYPVLRSSTIAHPASGTGVPNSGRRPRTVPKSFEGRLGLGKSNEGNGDGSNPFAAQQSKAGLRPKANSRRRKHQELLEILSARPPLRSAAPHHSRPTLFRSRSVDF